MMEIVAIACGQGMDFTSPENYEKAEARAPAEEKKCKRKSKKKGKTQKKASYCLVHFELKGLVMEWSGVRSAEC